MVRTPHGELSGLRCLVLLVVYGLAGLLNLHLCKLPDKDGYPWFHSPEPWVHLKYSRYPTPPCSTIRDRLEPLLGKLTMARKMKINMSMWSQSDCKQHLNLCADQGASVFQVRFMACDVKVRNAPRFHARHSWLRTFWASCLALQRKALSASSAVHLFACSNCLTISFYTV